MKMILNDLSYNNEIFFILDKYLSRCCINNFFELLFLLDKEGIIRDKGDIESYHNIITIDFGCNYHVYDWLNDSNRVKPDCKRFFYRIVDKYCSTVVDEMAKSGFYCEISGREYESKILHKAIEDDSRILSFKTIDFFSNDFITGIYRFLDEEQDDLKEEERIIHNICDVSQIDSLKEECKKDKYSNITSGYDFWEYRESLFPNLIFCKEVKKQIYNNLGRNHTIAVIKRMEILDDYYKEHNTFDLKTLGYNARDESDSVKNDKYLRSQREFKKPDGSVTAFYNHMSFSGDFNGRIYFDADDRLKKIYVGYIGPHLPTAKY